MERRRRVGAACVLSCGLLATPSAAAQNSQVCVLVYNDANVPMGVVSESEQLVGSIYRAAGVDLEWIHITDETQYCPERPVRVHLKLFSRWANRRLGQRRELLGFTPARSGIAYINEHRVREAADVLDVPLPVVLAGAMAHELGHLLLPRARHQQEGPMRSPFRQVDFLRLQEGRLNFKPEEGARLRAAVISLTEQRLARGKASPPGSNPVGTNRSLGRAAWPQ